MNPVRALCLSARPELTRLQLNALMDSDGNINTLGLQYIGAGAFVTPTSSGTAQGQAAPTFVPDPAATGVSGDSWPSIGAACARGVSAWLLLAALALAL